jgi:hypothetical protein
MRARHVLNIFAVLLVPAIFMACQKDAHKTPFLSSHNRRTEKPEETDSKAFGRKPVEAADTTVVDPNKPAQTEEEKALEAKALAEKSAVTTGEAPVRPEALKQEYAAYVVKDSEKTKDDKVQYALLIVDLKKTDDLGRAPTLSEYKMLIEYNPNSDKLLEPFFIPETSTKDEKVNNSASAVAALIAKSGEDTKENLLVAEDKKADLDVIAALFNEMFDELKDDVVVDNEAQALKELTVEGGTIVPDKTKVVAPAQPVE